MENLEFGIWVAHGEGKFVNVSSKTNIALQYVINSEPTDYTHSIRMVQNTVQQQSVLIMDGT